MFRLALAGAALAAWSLPALADPIVFQDHEDREVRLKAPAERVVSIPIPMASTIIAIDGSTEHLVGLNPTALAAIKEGILGRIFPEAAAIPDDVTAPNFIPNIEALAAVDPDLVIQWAGRGADYVDPITNAGMTAMLISYGTETKAREYMTMTATALGRPERIEQLIEWRAEVEADIRARSEAIAEGDRPRVLYLLRAGQGLRASATEGNYNAWYIDLAGGVNASAEIPSGTTDISVEQIASWNPDVILLNAFEADLDLSRILDDPILSLTNAAQGGRVYKMPLGGYRWDPPNQESPLTWMWLANLLHPEVFHYDLRAEMREAYRVLYDYELTDADMDEILRLDMQGAMTNYAQFAAQ